VRAARKAAIDRTRAVLVQTRALIARPGHVVRILGTAEVRTEFANRGAVPRPSTPEEFDRFVKAVSTTSYLIGIGKAPVFAAIIAVVGCFQGMRTRGGPDSVGRQTTRSVVQGIFLVIVADALFSVVLGGVGLWR
jgi:hypothetical protein